MADINENPIDFLEGLEGRENLSGQPSVEIANLLWSTIETFETNAESLDPQSPEGKKLKADIRELTKLKDRLVRAGRKLAREGLSEKEKTAVNASIKNVVEGLKQILGSRESMAGLKEQIEERQKLIAFVKDFRDVGARFTGSKAFEKILKDDDFGIFSIEKLPIEKLIELRNEILDISSTSYLAENFRLRGDSKAVLDKINDDTFYNYKDMKQMLHSLEVAFAADPSRLKQVNTLLSKVREMRRLSNDKTLSKDRGKRERKLKQMVTELKREITVLMLDMPKGVSVMENYEENQAKIKKIRDSKKYLIKADQNKKFDYYTPEKLDKLLVVIEERQPLIDLIEKNRASLPKTMRGKKVETLTTANLRQYKVEIKEKDAHIKKIESGKYYLTMEERSQDLGDLTIAQLTKLEGKIEKNEQDFPKFKSALSVISLGLSNTAIERYYSKYLENLKYPGLDALRTSLTQLKTKFDKMKSVQNKIFESEVENAKAEKELLSPKLQVEFPSIPSASDLYASFETDSVKQFTDDVVSVLSDLFNSASATVAGYTKWLDETLKLQKNELTKLDRTKKTLGKKKVIIEESSKLASLMEDLKDAGCDQRAGVRDADINTPKKNVLEQQKVLLTSQSDYYTQVVEDLKFEKTYLTQTTSSLLLATHETKLLGEILKNKERALKSIDKKIASFKAMIKDLKFALENADAEMAYIERLSKNRSLRKGNMEFASRKAAFLGEKVEQILRNIPLKETEFKRVRVAIEEAFPLLVEKGILKASKTPYLGSTDDILAKSRENMTDEDKMLLSRYADLVNFYNNSNDALTNAGNEAKILAFEKKCLEGDFDLQEALDVRRSISSASRNRIDEIIGLYFPSYFASTEYNSIAQNGLGKAAGEFSMVFTGDAIKYFMNALQSTGGVIESSESSVAAFQGKAGEIINLMYAGGDKMIDAIDMIEGDLAVLSKHNMTASPIYKHLSAARDQYQSLYDSFHPDSENGKELITFLRLVQTDVKHWSVGNQLSAAWTRFTRPESLKILLLSVAVGMAFMAGFGMPIIAAYGLGNTGAILVGSAAMATGMTLGQELLIKPWILDQGIDIGDSVWDWSKSWGKTFAYSVALGGAGMKFVKILKNTHGLGVFGRGILKVTEISIPVPANAAGIRGFLYQTFVRTPMEGAQELFEEGLQAVDPLVALPLELLFAADGTNIDFNLHSTFAKSLDSSKITALHIGEFDAVYEYDISTRELLFSKLNSIDPNITTDFGKNGEIIVQFSRDGQDYTYTFLDSKESYSARSFFSTDIGVAIEHDFAMDMTGDGAYSYQGNARALGNMLKNAGFTVSRTKAGEVLAFKGKLSFEFNPGTKAAKESQRMAALRGSDRLTLLTETKAMREASPGRLVVLGGKAISNRAGSALSRMVDWATPGSPALDSNAETVLETKLTKAVQNQLSARGFPADYLSGLSLVEQVKVISMVNSAEQEARTAGEFLVDESADIPGRSLSPERYVDILRSGPLGEVAFRLMLFSPSSSLDMAVKFGAFNLDNVIQIAEINPALADEFAYALAQNNPEAFQQMHEQTVEEWLLTFGKTKEDAIAKLQESIDLMMKKGKSFKKALDDVMLDMADPNTLGVGIPSWAKKKINPRLATVPALILGGVVFVKSGGIPLIGTLAKWGLKVSIVNTAVATGVVLLLLYVNRLNNSFFIRQRSIQNARTMAKMRDEQFQMFMRMFDPTLINPNRNKDITSEDRAASRFGMRNSMEPPPKVFFDQALDYHFFGDIRRDGILKEGIDPAVDPFAAVVPGADPTLLTDMVGQFQEESKTLQTKLEELRTYASQKRTTALIASEVDNKIVPVLQAMESKMHPKKLRDRFKKAHEAWTKQLKADLGKAPPKTETLKGWVNNAVNTIKAMPNNANFTSDATNELINLRDRISKVFKPKKKLKEVQEKIDAWAKILQPRTVRGVVVTITPDLFALNQEVITSLNEHKGGTGAVNKNVEMTDEMNGLIELNSANPNMSGVPLYLSNDLSVDSAPEMYYLYLNIWKLFCLKPNNPHFTNDIRQNLGQRVDEVIMFFSTLAKNYGDTDAIMTELVKAREPMTEDNVKKLLEKKKGEFNEALKTHQANAKEANTLIRDVLHKSGEKNTGKGGETPDGKLDRKTRFFNWARKNKGKALILTFVSYLLLRATLGDDEGTGKETIEGTPEGTTDPVEQADVDVFKMKLGGMTERVMKSIKDLGVEVEPASVFSEGKNSRLKAEGLVAAKGRAGMYEEKIDLINTELEKDSDLSDADIATLEGIQEYLLALNTGDYKKNDDYEYGLRYMIARAKKKMQIAHKILGLDPIPERDLENIRLTDDENEE